MARTNDIIIAFYDSIFFFFKVG